MKTAVVHDWLVTYAGAERVLEQILLLYPEADLYSLFDFLPEDSRGFILNKKVCTSFLQKLPFATRRYRNFLLFMPSAIERFDLSRYDLIISSSHAVAKGVVTRPGQLHVCYCHTPVRYAWDLSDQYLEAAGLNRGIKGRLAKSILNYIRNWDLRTTERVGHFIANSRYIAERIKRTYGREAEVIYPPVDTDGFTVQAEKEDFYLAASRMVPYKRIDLIVEAFAALPDEKLVVIGDGPDFRKVKSRASGNIELLGYQPSRVLGNFMQRAKAFVFAAEEDFGITPVEAQACGTPVIAFGRGGAMETIVENETGIFFREQTVKSLVAAIEEFERVKDGFSPYVVRKNAEVFNRDRFKNEFRQYVEKLKTA